ncbi:MAG: FecR domain-containing protein [Oscillatoriales cyanobacterium C42_A2020_001]|nr:FecR domain-containing protein [Leptolyngbyaceae cyanobacterium C42_A2020_001]
MASRSLLALASSLLSAGIVVLSLPASAETLLTKATVQRLRNKVELHLKQKQLPRQAQKADTMTPGDALRTFQKAMAELRFNDNSLARIGEQAVFYFESNTRNFQLDSGTVLLLIQPGQGKTRIRTPNAAAGIRGSALFVRYLPDTQVTMVGALTNSDIEISNKDGTTVTLKAGQIGYVYQDRIGVYNFDQRQFQETSPFFKEIDWNEAPVAVKEEIEAALSGQQTFTGKYDDTPVWTKLAENRSVPPQQNFATADRVEATQFPAGRAPTVVTIPSTPGQPQQPQQIGSQPEPPREVRPEPQPITRPEPTVPTTPSARPEPITTPSTPVAPPVASTTPRTNQPAVPSQPIQSTPPTSQTPSAVSPPTRPVPSAPSPATPTSVSTAPTVTPPTTTPVNNMPTVTPPTTTPPVSTTPPTTTTPVSATPATPPVTSTPATPTTPTRTEPVVTPTPASITPPVQSPPTVTPSVTPVVNSSPVTASPQTTPAATTPVATSAATQTPAAVSTTPATSPLDLPSVQPAVSTTTTTPSTTTTTSTRATP